MRRLTVLLGLTVVVGVLLAGCAVSGLSVTPNYIRMTANSVQFEVSNTSNRDVTFTTRSSSPYLSLSPSSATVTPDTPVVVTATMDSRSLSPGANLSMTATLDSDAGSATVRLDYGIGTCGSYTPPATAASLGISALAVAPSHASSSAQPSASPDAVPGQIIVGYVAPSGIHAASLRSQALEHTSRVVRSAYGLGLLAGGTGEGPDLVQASDVPGTLARLRADPRVRYAQRNVRVHALYVPNDTYYKPSTTFPYGQWNLTDFGLETAWNKETGADNGPVVVAVLDNGVDPNHEDFQNPAPSGSGSKVLQGWDFVDGDATASPATGDTHGTHVAGIAAAVGDNNKGIAGVAYDYNVKILPVRVLMGESGTVYNVANGIRWAAGLPVSGVSAHPSKRADVINMSLGVSGDQPALDAAAQDAWDQGSVLVAAAGNWGPGTGEASDPGVESPANAPCVIAVGSVDGPGKGSYPLSSFSDTGPQIEVVAPGGLYTSADANSGIISAIPGGNEMNYTTMIGTSMASPFVAGIAALLKAHDPTMTPAQIRTRIDQTTDRPSGADRRKYGYGVACADKALGASTTCGQ